MVAAIVVDAAAAAAVGFIVVARPKLPLMVGDDGAGGAVVGVRIAGDVSRPIVVGLSDETGTDWELVCGQSGGHCGRAFVRCATSCVCAVFV